MDCCLSPRWLFVEALLEWNLATACVWKYPQWPDCRGHWACEVWLFYSSLHAAHQGAQDLHPNVCVIGVSLWAKFRLRARKYPSTLSSKRFLVRAHLFLHAEECRIKWELLVENKCVKGNLGLKAIWSEQEQVSFCLHGFNQEQLHVKTAVILGLQIRCLAMSCHVWSLYHWLLNGNKLLDMQYHSHYCRTIFHCIFYFACNFYST